MTTEVSNATKKKMQETIQFFKKELSNIRTGRANPGLIETVKVDYYGTMTPILQMATVSVPDASSLVVQPWDMSALAEVEKAILRSNLGLTPTNDGKVLRIHLPPLTEERRKDLVKVVKKLAEETRVEVRNERRDSNEKLKALEKDKKATEDETKKALADIQKITDEAIKEVDQLSKHKEEELMKV